MISTLQVETKIVIAAVAASQNQHSDFIKQHWFPARSAAADMDNIRWRLPADIHGSLSGSLHSSHWRPGGTLEIVDRIAVGFIVNPDGRDMAD